MAYFIPSFIQKRVLRYALVRLDLLETHSLELEKLDIAWGRSSTIELKEVAIRTDKLIALLRLPQYISVTEAKVQNLKITVPADLYRSSISVELHEIKISITVSEQDTVKGQDSTNDRQHGERSDVRQQAGSERSQDDQFRVHDPGGVAKDEDTGDSTSRSGNRDLPITQDLAQSFLQSQPPEKRNELQAAVTRSQILKQSVPYEGSALEASDVGVGNTLSLPAFLADFLQGVGDRLKVCLKDITIDLKIDIETSPDGPPKSRNERKSEEMVVRLRVGSVNVHEATKDLSPSESFSAGDVSMQRAGSKRRLSLRDIQAQIITAPTVFSCFTQDVSPPSPGTTRSSTLWHAQKTSSESPSTHNSGTTTEDLSMSVSDLRNMASQDALAGASFSSYNTARSGSLALANSPPDLAQVAQGDSTDRVTIDSFYSTIGDRDESSGTAGRDSSSLGAPKSGEPASESSFFFNPSYPPKPASNDSLSSSRKTQYERNRANFSKQADNFKFQKQKPVSIFGEEENMDTERLSQELPSPPSSENGFSISPSENLEASQFFSHEQATSMYMSALSTDYPQPRESPQSPGAWAASHTDKGPPQEATFPQPRVFQDTTPHHTFESLSQRKNDHRENALPTYSSSLESTKADLDQPADSNSPDAEETPYLTESELPASPLSQKTDQPHTPARRLPDSADSVLRRKTFLDIDMIHIDIIDGNLMTRALSKSFDSAHPASTANVTSGSIQMNAQDPPQGAEEIPDVHTSQASSHESGTLVSVTAGTVIINLDIGLIRMMLLVLGKTNKLYSAPEAAATNVSKGSITQASLHKIAVRDLSCRLLEHVEEHSIATADSIASPGTRANSDYQEPDVLLACRLSSIRISHLETGLRKSIKGSVAKFSFGYADEAIFSFRSGMNVKDSTRDISASASDDITFNVVKSQSTISIDIATQPLVATLNLQKVDEVFAWVGGFSGIMSLGSSMASTITMLDTRPKKSGHPNRTRTVHFDGASQDHFSGASINMPQQKITARVGGVIFDLRGAACSLKIETTAVKAVSRAEGIGLQVDRVNLRGPFRESMDSKDSIILQLSNVRIEYLATPKEVDLSRLLAMLSPSKDKYDRDDDILLDTLLRQRRKAGVARATVEKVYISMTDPQDLSLFPLLGEELKKLSTVTKYLPEDDRPGLLTLGLIRSFEVEYTVNERFGAACVTGQNLEVAHVTFPTLITMGIGNFTLSRDSTETFIRKDAFSGLNDAASLPMMMVRFIGNEMEPTVKLKLHHVQFEYHILPLMALFGLEDADAAERMGADMASSIATLTTPKPAAEASPNSSDEPFSSGEILTSPSKSLGLRVHFSNSSIALNPYKSASQALLVLSDAEFQGSTQKQGRADAVFSVKKATLMVIDDQKNLIGPVITNTEKPREHLEHLEAVGFVTVCRISSAHVKVRIVNTPELANPLIDVDVRDDLFVLETCADSTQTLVQILSGLAPPLPKSHKPKYQTEVVPVQDMLASFTGATFPVGQKLSPDEELDPLLFDEGDMMDDDVPQNLEFVSSFYDPDPDAASLGIADSMLEDDLASLARPPVQREIGDKNTLQSFVGQSQIAPGNPPLDFKEDHFGSPPNPSSRKEKRKVSTGLLQDASSQGGISIRVRDVHVIWNLFDGYDWKKTRDAISQAVAEVENRATERVVRNQKTKNLDPEDEPDNVIGDFLFNSIYIGIPSKGDPTDLTRHVNANIDDLYSETGSESTSRPASSPGRTTPKPPRRHRRLRLMRSKHHKMTFELKGVSSDISIFPPGVGEIETSVDLRVHDLDIFDHVPTSTWKKFATYMRDAGERESGLSLIHIQIQNVRPVPNLAATEIILKVSFL